MSILQCFAGSLEPEAQQATEEASGAEKRWWHSYFVPAARLGSKAADRQTTNALAPLKPQVLLRDHHCLSASSTSCKRAIRMGLKSLQLKPGLFCLQGQ